MRAIVKISILFIQIYLLITNNFVMQFIWSIFIHYFLLNRTKNIMRNYSCECPFKQASWFTFLMCSDTLVNKWSLNACLGAQKIKRARHTNLEKSIKYSTISFWNAIVKCYHHVTCSFVSSLRASQICALWCWKRWSVIFSTREPFFLHISMCN